VTARVRDVFGERVVGVYTTGLLALGDYRPGRSDIDLMAVVARSQDFDLRRQLARQLDHQVLSCPAAGLEFVRYPLTTVSQSTLDAGYLLNFKTGSALPPVTSFDPGDAPAFWYAIDRVITRQSGTPLYGPPPTALCRIALRRSPSNRDRLSGSSQRPAGRAPPRHAFLNCCRALSFARDCRWYAKVEAAERTGPVAGEFAPLVSAAIASFNSGRREAIALDSDTVRAFLSEVMQRLRSALRVGLSKRIQHQNLGQTRGGEVTPME
jgi:hypothetical protein